MNILILGDVVGPSGVKAIQKKLPEEEIIEIAINAGALDCKNLKNHNQIITKKEDFYKVKNLIERKVDNIIKNILQ